ncbi:HPr family phosphocarrier protein [Hungatella hathewayi]|uniref:HPr family phosphocarrier protein n=1 Tax=Hungatella hathewayi TaxID=154046 RepID=UPI003D80DE6D
MHGGVRGRELITPSYSIKEAMNFKSSVNFRFKNTTANAKSVLSVLGACVKSGDEIEFVCEGVDEKEALAAMVQAVEDGLGE